MRAKKKIAPTKIDAGCLGKNLRFQSVAQVNVVKRAAERRGWSVNAFIIRVAYAAALRELETPPMEIVGVPIEGLDQRIPT